MPGKTGTQGQKTDEQAWKRMSFKGNKVWAAIGPDGNFLIKNNKILIKYNLKQDYEYLIKKDNLKPEDKAVPGKIKKGETKSTKTKKSDTSLIYDTCKSKYDKNTSNKTTPDKNKRYDSTSINIPVNENTIIIYTDGASSGNPGSAGIGAVLVFNGHKKEISEFIGTATNNIAELTAIRKALEKLERWDLPVRLFTDSTYCTGVLSKGWKPKKNLDLINKIKKLINKFKNLKIIKVKGHAGIELNERADILATSAIKNRNKN